MQRTEFFKLPRRQQIADECSKFFNFRHQRLQRLILNEDLLPSEKAALTCLEGELGILENIIVDELNELDAKLETTLNQIQEAKAAEKFR